MEFKNWMESAAVGNAKKINDLFARGINRSDPSIVGYHGTSVQTLASAIEKGYIPVTKGLGAVHGGDSYKGEEYGIHIVPNMGNRIVGQINFRREPEHPDPFVVAMKWADYVSKKHAIFDRYGMDFGRVPHHKAANSIISGESPRAVVRGLKLREPNNTPIKGGVVLAISDKVSESFELSMGGDGDDINIKTRALPIEYILGIEPQNDDAYHWLDRLGDSL